MRWARYLVDGKETFGIINGENVIDVLGNPFDGFQQTENTQQTGGFGQTDDP